MPLPRHSAWRPSAVRYLPKAPPRALRPPQAVAPMQAVTPPLLSLRRPAWVHAVAALAVRVLLQRAAAPSLESSGPAKARCSARSSHSHRRRTPCLHTERRPLRSASVMYRRRCFRQRRIACHARLRPRARRRVRGCLYRSRSPCPAAGSRDGGSARRSSSRRSRRGRSARHAPRRGLPGCSRSCVTRRRRVRDAWRSCSRSMPRRTRSFRSSLASYVIDSAPLRWSRPERSSCARWHRRPNRAQVAPSAGSTHGSTRNGRGGPRSRSSSPSTNAVPSRPNARP